MRGGVCVFASATSFYESTFSLGACEHEPRVQIHHKFQCALARRLRKECLILVRLESEFFHLGALVCALRTSPFPCKRAREAKSYALQTQLDLGFSGYFWIFSQKRQNTSMGCSMSTVPIRGTNMLFRICVFVFPKKAPTSCCVSHK